MAAVRLSIRIKQTWLKKVGLGGTKGAMPGITNHGGFLKQNCFNNVKVLLDCWVAGVLMPSDLVDVGSKAVFLLPHFFRVIFNFALLWRR